MDPSNNIHTRRNVIGNTKFPLMPMGVLAARSAHARPSARPPSTCAEIFQRTCLGGVTLFLKVFLMKFLAKLGNLGNLVVILIFFFWDFRYGVRDSGGYNNIQEDIIRFRRI